MDRRSLRRIGDFMTAVISTMSCVPLPMPSDVRDQWDGTLFDTLPLHKAYSRLPGHLQETFELVYRLCLHIIDRQDKAARLAFMARMQAFADLITATGLTYEQALPLMKDEEDPEKRPQLSLVTDEFVEQAALGADEDVASGTEKDEDEIELAHMLQQGLRKEIEALLEYHGSPPEKPAATKGDDGRQPPQDEPASNTEQPERQQGRAPAPWHSVALASLVAVAAAVTLIWHEPSKPSAPQPSEAHAQPATFSINQSVSNDDMTFIVSHGENDIKGITRIITYLVNSSDQDQPVTVSVDDESQAPAGPTIVPAKSTRRQVVDVQAKGKPVRLEVKAPPLHDTVTLDLP